MRPQRYVGSRSSSQGASQAPNNSGSSRPAASTPNSGGGNRRVQNLDLGLIPVGTLGLSALGLALGWGPFGWVLLLGGLPGLLGKKKAFAWLASGLGLVVLAAGTYAPELEKHQRASQAPRTRSGGSRMSLVREEKVYTLPHHLTLGQGEIAEIAISGMATYTVPGSGNQVRFSPTSGEFVSYYGRESCSRVKGTRTKETCWGMPLLGQTPLHEVKGPISGSLELNIAGPMDQVDFPSGLIIRVLK